MPGQPFADYYLTDGVRETDEREQSMFSLGELESFRQGISARDELFMGYSRAN